MISLAPFAISQRLQPPDKLLVSVRGNGIQRPGEALSVFRSLSQIRLQGELQLAQDGCKRFGFFLNNNNFQLVVYLLIEGGGGDGRPSESCICQYHRLKYYKSFQGYLLSITTPPRRWCVTLYNSLFRPKHRHSMSADGYSIKALGLPSLHITPPHRCSNHFFAPNFPGTASKQGRVEQPGRLHILKDPQCDKWCSSCWCLITGREAQTVAILNRSQFLTEIPKNEHNKDEVGSKLIFAAAPHLTVVSPVHLWNYFGK